MRITSDVMVSRTLERLQTRLQAYERTQSELATGKRILKPSDDPAGARRAIGIQQAMRAREQDLNNISDGLGWLNAADSQLQAAGDRMARVRELTIGAATVTGQGERVAIATEIREIRDELIAIGNHQHLGRPMFGGYADGDAIELDDADEWVSKGDGDEVRRRVSDSETVRVNVTAAEWMGFDDGEDLITMLGNLADEVEGGDQAVVSGRLGDLDRAIGRIGDALSVIGSATNRVASARDRAESLALTLRTELSEVQDVDLAQGLMEQQIQQVGYEATLQSLSKALPPSLVSFLR